MNAFLASIDTLRKKVLNFINESYWKLEVEY